MTMRNERKEKLLKVIDEAVASSSSSIEALDEILKWRKENDGLKGIHFSIYPTSEDGTLDKEKVAEDMIKMIRCMANGDYEIITDLDI
jgi:predicted  nucleic acid-binding Zn-ribbon protein